MLARLLSMFKLSLSEIAVLLAACVLFLCGLRQSQLGAHHYCVSVGNHVLIDEMRTNRFQVEIKTKLVPSPAGLRVVVIRETNELWSVWRIFRQ